MQFTLDVYIDFSKAFEAVGHKALTKKLEKYGIKQQHIDWFKSYLNSGKQYVYYPERATSSEEITPLITAIWLYGAKILIFVGIYILTLNISKSKKSFAKF